MHIHCFQHVPFEGLGNISGWAKDQGFPVTTTQFYRSTLLPDPASVDFLVIMGGPMSVHDTDECSWLETEKRYVRDMIRRGKIILGICLGAQIVAEALGGRIYPNDVREIGWFPVERTGEASTSPLGQAFPERFEAFHWHGETFEIPDGCVHLAKSEACENQAFSLGDNILGMQFHLDTIPESVGGLIENCGDDLAPGPFVQTAGEIWRDGGRIARIETWMRQILDAITGHAGR